MTVSSDILTETRFLLISVLAGAGMVILYDFFRILRRVIHHGTIWIAMEDVVYWLFCAFFVFSMLYKENDGLIRGFAMGGIVIGMLIYNCFVSPFVIKYVSKVLTFFLKIIRKVLEILIKPLKKVKKILKKLLKIVRIGLCKL